jgi:cell division septation protein DedD
VAQDDYFYEIQLTNKQLVFYFMAGATGLILSFLAGVMVGRGVDQTGEVQAARAPAAEERVVEETPVPAPPPAAAADLTYAQRLEAERPDEKLERPAAGTSGAPPATRTANAFPSRPAVAPPAPAAAKPSAAPRASAPAPAAGAFTIQVGAFKDGASAETIVSRLKEKGFEAYVMPPPQPGGLFNVRVGSFRERDDADKVHARLQQEKFKPFIVKK